MYVCKSDVANTRAITSFRKGNMLISEKVEKNAFEFYKNKWDMSPIVNCTTMESVIAYNLIRKNIFIYIMVAALYKFKSIIKSLIKKMLRKMVNTFFMPFEIEIIRYKLTKILKKNSVEVVQCKIVSESLFKLGNNFKSFIWRRILG